MSGFQQVVLDDRDPSITYTGSWGQEGNPSIEFDGTTTVGTPGPNMFATLNFKAAGVTVKGTIAPGSLQVSSYILDGGSATTFSSTNSTDTRYFQVFFTAQELDPTVQHTLVIQPVQDVMFLDMFELAVPLVSDITTTTSTTTTSSRITTAPTIPPTPVAIPSPTTTTKSTTSVVPIATSAPGTQPTVAPIPATTVATSSSTPNTPPTTPTSLASDLTTPSALPADTTSSSSKSTVPIGPIIGGVLGGLVLIIAFFLALLFMRRKSRSHPAASGVIYQTPASGNPTSISPYTYAPVRPHVPHTSPDTHSTAYGRSSLSPGPNHSFSSRPSEKGSELHPAPTAASHAHSASLSYLDRSASLSFERARDSATTMDPPPIYQHGRT